MWFRFDVKEQEADDSEQEVDSVNGNEEEESGRLNLNIQLK